MLELVVKEDELYLPHLNKFIEVPECTITLEHSLISLARWESKWHIPYLSNKERTQEQELDYIRCMSVNKLKNDLVIKILSPMDIKTIEDYIDNPMTATTFSKNIKNQRSKKEIITAEIIYSRMFAHGIPLECQKWHLNRLLTLLRVCDLRNTPPQKMGRKETAQWNAQQNALRRAKLNSRG